jgi:hypothetical protein
MRLRGTEEGRVLRNAGRDDGEVVRALNLFGAAYHAHAEVLKCTGRLTLMGVCAPIERYGCHPAAKQAGQDAVDAAKDKVNEATDAAKQAGKDAVDKAANKAKDLLK